MGIDSKKFLVGIAGLVIGLYLISQLTKEIFIGLSALAAFVLFSDKQDKKIISLPTAEMIAIKETERRQQLGSVDKGRVRVMNQSELESLHYEGEIEPYAYPIGVIVQSNKAIKYLVKVSVEGNIMLFTPLKEVGWSVTKIPEFHHMEASGKEALGDLSRSKEDVPAKVKKEVEEDEDM